MDPRTVVKVALAERGMTLSELANRLGVPQQSLSRTIQQSPLNGKSHWPKILDALGLEIVIQRKGADNADQ